MFRLDAPGGVELRQPAYHLRPNKAIDRQLLIDSIRRLEQLWALDEYTYFGFGGPYLEDFRILYELCKDIGMVSIERDAEVVKRQWFHRPSETVRIRHIDLFDFVNQYEGDTKSIFWLDFTNLRYDNFECFKLLLARVVEGSIVKISLRADPADYLDTPEKFAQRFRSLMPNPSANPPAQSSEYAKFLQDMLRVAVQQALPVQLGVVFQPISSFFYSDGTNMLTLTGIVCGQSLTCPIRELFVDWEFSNVNWNKPLQIDVPFLSTKERLHLQHCLPGSSSVVQGLMFRLGYLLDVDEIRTKRQLANYAAFHRQYPYFIRAMP